MQMRRLAEDMSEGSDLKGRIEADRVHCTSENPFFETRTLAPGPVGSGGSERVNCLVNPSNSIQTFSPEMLGLFARIDVFLINGSTD